MSILIDAMRPKVLRFALNLWGFGKITKEDIEGHTPVWIQICRILLEKKFKGQIEEDINLFKIQLTKLDELRVIKRIDYHTYFVFFNIVNIFKEEQGLKNKSSQVLLQRFYAFFYQITISFEQFKKFIGISNTKGLKLKKFGHLGIEFLKSSRKFIEFLKEHEQLII